MIRFGTSIAGTAGFVFVFGLGMALDRDWGRTTISASIAALTFAFLVHWWMTFRNPICQDLTDSARGLDSNRIEPCRHKEIIKFGR